MSRNLLFVGGALNGVCAVFHVLFWRYLHWKEDLATLTELNRVVMQLLNVAVICVMCLFAYLSFFHADALVLPGLGQAVVAGIVGLYTVRAIAGLILGEYRTKQDLAVQLFLLTIVVVYAVPLVGSRM